jgi:hypothetical protein
MKFLRFLSLVLIAIMYSSSLLTEITLSFDDLKKIGLVEGAQLRIGSGNTWGYIQYKGTFNNYYFTLPTNPTNMESGYEFGNLASIFIVNRKGDQVSLRTLFGGGGFSVGGQWMQYKDDYTTKFYQAGPPVTRYLCNPSCTATEVLYTVVATSDPTVHKTGTYSLGFQSINNGVTTYLTPGINVQAASIPQYFSIEVLTAQRDTTSRGKLLDYDNTCYQIFIAGTPLNAWLSTDNYYGKKKLFFGPVTYCSGEMDQRPSSLANKMCVLNATNQNQKSSGVIRYGDLIRIIGLRTAQAAANPAIVNNFVEAYPWVACSVPTSSVLIDNIGGLVGTIGSQFIYTDDPKQVFIITSALNPTDKTPIYPIGTPVYEKDAIRLIAYWTLVPNTSYPYVQSSNLFFSNHWGDLRYTGAFLNTYQTTDAQLFSFEKTSIDETAPRISEAHNAWNLSSEYQNFIVPVVKATTIATIVDTAGKALGQTFTGDNKNIAAGACATALEKAIPLATTSAQCDQIGSYLSTLGTKGISVTNLQAKLQARKDQITTKQAEKKEAQDTSKAGEAAHIAALKTKDISAMISALNDIINATPDNKANVKNAIAAAFTAATSLVKTTADGAALLACFTAAIKKGYVTAGARSAFDARYAQIKTEAAAVNAFTQKTTLVDLNKALASVVGYKTPITAGLAAQVLIGIGKAIGAAQAQWKHVQSLRQIASQKGATARDATAAQQTFANLKTGCNDLAAYIKAVAAMPLTKSQMDSRNKLSNDLSNFQMTLK